VLGGRVLYPSYSMFKYLSRIENVQHLDIYLLEYLQILRIVRYLSLHLVFASLNASTLNRTLTSSVRRLTDHITKPYKTPTYAYLSTISSMRRPATADGRPASDGRRLTEADGYSLPLRWQRRHRHRHRHQHHYQSVEASITIWRQQYGRRRDR